jgi:hypothetical protein
MISPRLIRCGGLAAAIGGLLWALFPLGEVIVSTHDTQPGTPAHLAAEAVDWLMAVVPLLLLIVGQAALHTLHRRDYGRLGNAGFLLSLVALSLMFVGNGWEIASITFRGSGSDVGHSVFLAGFLLLLMGSALFGFAIVRTQRDLSWRIGGLLLVAALPLGILFGSVGGVISPETDLGFWAAITVPYGVAWALLGYALFSEGSASLEQATPAG